MSDNLLDFIGKGSDLKATTKHHKRSTILIFDFSQIIYNSKVNLVTYLEERKKKSPLIPSAYVAKMEKPDDDFFEAINLMKHFTINSVMGNCRRFNNVEKVVLAVEGGGSWRKKYLRDLGITKVYKQNRTITREADDFDWARFWVQVDAFYNELAEHFPFYLIRVAGAEGDDVIAELARKFSTERPDADTVILSRDHDFKQLLSLPHVTMYNFYDKKYVDCPNPEDTLLEQILCGDRGDGVPNVLSDIDTFVVPGKRQKPLGEKAVWKAISTNTVKTSILVDDRVKERFEQNRTLVDLSRTPEEIKKSIRDTYEEQVALFPSKGPQKLLRHLADNRLNNIIDRISQLSNLFNK